jgi:hypothetical protein
MTRALASAVGIFYLLSGAAAFFAPTTFYSAVATFSPFNLHLFHDAGAFQIGLGAALVAAAVAGRGLAPVLLGVLVGSLFHLFAHVIDIRLGGHPTTDIPILSILVLVLAFAFLLEIRTVAREKSS